MILYNRKEIKITKKELKEIDKKRIESDRLAEIELEDIRNKLNIKKNNDCFVYIEDIKTIFRKHRLSRLVYISIAVQKECFFKEINDFLFDKFEIAYLRTNTFRVITKLTEYNLIEIKRLTEDKKNLCKKFEKVYFNDGFKNMLRKKIKYYSFISHRKNVNLLKYCLDLEKQDINNNFK